MATLITPTQVPRIDVDTARKCFEAIWQTNIQEVTLTRNDNPQGGDYFHDDEEVKPQVRTVFMNVQGTMSDYYRRERYGITTTDSEFHAYARWFEDIENNDIITFDGKRFIIKNQNRSFTEGLVVWQEFDLKRVDKSSS